MREKSETLMTKDPRIELITDLKRRFEQDPDSLVDRTADLSDADFTLIGKVVQFYCFADFNGRRVIDSLKYAAIGPEARNASRLQDAQVFPELRKAANLLWNCPLKEGLVRAANTIEMHRIHRHNFSHWAARKFKNERAWILLSKNAREGERRDGQSPEPDEAKFGIMPLDGFNEEVNKLADHGAYLAQQASHIESHLNEFKKEFARQR